MFNNSVTALVTEGFFIKDVINLPQPSGSSVQEVPPARTKTLVFCNALEKPFTPSVISAAVKLRIINISGLPPAFSTALETSYSLFVPGRSGIKKRGFANRDFGFITTPLL